MPKRVGFSIDKWKCYGMKHKGMLQQDLHCCKVKRNSTPQHKTFTVQQQGCSNPSSHLQVQQPLRSSQIQQLGAGDAHTEEKTTKRPRLGSS
ncbi:hypothetical protein LR48_Vigan623s000200 [Vigna angularis]|uniref:Uncharacterized protein n=2 Tax=Phaseolus angularis TaxID=3914 RepID=A0A0L9TED1_PHAAN|nr:hypothetical protein LR48_Vigan623s000200 [Vigna angularis]BAT97782.1 hypothetical protein VIGAN_09133000 [Vigna angularis var. angularis]